MELWYKFECETTKLGLSRVFRLGLPAFPLKAINACVGDACE